jgi:NADPH:quinone reductase-like Zn-dependent oxidoreductase
MHTGFWVVNWLRHAPRAEIEQTYRTLSDLVATGVVAVPVDATYRLADYREAFERAMTQGRTGKILFTFA